MVYGTGDPIVDDAMWRVLNGDELNRTSGIAPITQPVEPLVAGANYVHSVRSDGTVDACSIVNAKTGDCTENCGFYAQSAHFGTGIEAHGFPGAEAVLDAAQRAKRDDVQRFGIVVVEKGISKEHRPDEWADVPGATRLVRDETSVEIGALFGLLTEEGARILADEGVDHHNHDIETSPWHFDRMAKTRDFEDRLVTFRRAKDAGMDLCAGVILGMSGTPADRVDVALELQKISVEPFPVNVLNLVPGTPLGDAGYAGIMTTEFVRTVVIYRLFYPNAYVRLTGGREANLAPNGQHLPFEASVDDVLISDYLTTDDQSPTADIEVVERAGLEPNHTVNGFDVDTVKR